MRGREGTFRASLSWEVNLRLRNKRLQIIDKLQFRFFSRTPWTMTLPFWMGTILGFQCEIKSRVLLCWGNEVNVWTFFFTFLPTMQRPKGWNIQYQRRFGPLDSVFDRFKEKPFFLSLSFSKVKFTQPRSGCGVKAEDLFFSFLLNWKIHRRVLRFWMNNTPGLRCLIPISAKTSQVSYQLFKIWSSPKCSIRGWTSCVEEKWDEICWWANIWASRLNPMYWMNVSICQVSRHFQGWFSVLLCYTRALVGKSSRLVFVPPLWISIFLGFKLLIELEFA